MATFKGIFIAAVWIVHHPTCGLVVGEDRIEQAMIDNEFPWSRIGPLLIAVPLLGVSYGALRWMFARVEEALDSNALVISSDQNHLHGFA